LITLDNNNQRVDDHILLFLQNRGNHFCRFSRCKDSDLESLVYKKKYADFEAFS
jgi:hypothetical protein